MKQLITLSILLLAGPSLVSAQVSTETLDVTSGSMILLPTDPSTTFTAAGSGFLYSGEITLETPVIPPGSFGVGPPGAQFSFQANTTDGTLSNLSLTLHGVSWEVPSDGSGGAEVIFGTSPVVFSGPGTFYGSFTFSGPFAGLSEGTSCFQVPCSVFQFQGGGTVTYDVVPFQNPMFPGALTISQATFTFKAPEPSTASLLLLGFAGLGILGLRRSSRATFLASG